MTKRTETFTYSEDDNSGEHSWINDKIIANLEGDEIVGCYDARILAHDVVEHMGSDDIGCPVDELLALGAVYYTRVDTGILYSRDRSSDVLSSDVSALIHYSYLIDNDFRSEHWDGMESYWKAHWLVIARAGISEQSDWTPDDVKLARAIAHYLCEGYHMADELYNTSDSAYYLFTEITEECTPYFTKECSEGDTLAITVDGSDLISVEYTDIYDSYIEEEELAA